MRPIQSGKRLLHGSTAGQHVRDPRRNPQIVLQYREAVVGPHDIRAADGDVYVVGHLQPLHLDPVLRTSQDQVVGHDSVAQRPAFVVDVPEEEVERGQALLETPVDVIPLGRREQPRDAVDGDDLFGCLARADHGEGDPFVDEAACYALLKLRQLLRRCRRERRAQPPRCPAEASVRAEHLVVEGRVQLVARECPGPGRTGPGHVGETAVDGQGGGRQGLGTRPRDRGSRCPRPDRPSARTRGRLPGRVPPHPGRSPRRCERL